MLLTFSQLKASDVPADAGVCATSPDFLSLTNKAVRMLMNRGSFFGTTQRIQLCTFGGCATWPRYVGTVLATNLNGQHSHPKNNWWEFLDTQRSDFALNGIFPWVNGSFGSAPLVDANTSPVFNPISCGHPVYLRVYPSLKEDVGKVTTFYGVDSNGQVIRTKNSLGVWQEGVTITMALPFSQTPMLIREVTRITKDVTVGVVRYFQYEPIKQSVFDLVSYDPSETTPMYRSSKVGAGRGGCCITSIQALIKMEFIPVLVDSDIVQIGNLDALSDMMKSIREKKAEHIQEAQALEASAVRELNLELRTKFPNDSITTHVNYGELRMPRQMV